MLVYDDREQLLLCRPEADRQLFSAALYVADGEGEHRFEGTQAAEAVTGRAGPWAVSLAMDRAAGWDRAVVEVSPVAGRRLERVFFRMEGGRDLLPPLDVPTTRMLCMPFGFAELSNVVTLGEGVQAESSVSVLLSDPAAEHAVLAGIDEPAEDRSQFRADGGRLECGFSVRREIVSPRRYAMVFGEGRDALALQDRYGEHLGRLARPVPGPVIGWNSWDYYGGAISMEAVREEMRALNAGGLGESCEYVVLDMGWHGAWGDWRPNRRFPESLAAIATEIREAGFRPGIWTAPLLVDRFEPLARFRPELFVQAPTGGPVICPDEKLILDFSLPAVHELLGGWFAGMREAGFELFKIDYIYKDYIDRVDRWGVEGRGDIAAIRDGLAAIRAAVGEDAHILGCGGPGEAQLGLVDSARLGMDIHNFWGHIRYDGRQVAARQWTNGRLWRGDPDFAIIRSETTTDDRNLNLPYTRKPEGVGEGLDFWLAGEEAGECELLTWLSVVKLSGGNMFFSDSIARLNDRGLDLLRRVLPPLDTPARPLDLYTAEIPRFWLSEGEGETWLGVFNWSDREETLEVPRGLDLPAGGRDLWTGRQVALEAGEVLPPRSALLLQC